MDASKKLSMLAGSVGFDRILDTNTPFFNPLLAAKAMPWRETISPFVKFLSSNAGVIAVLPKVGSPTVLVTGEASLVITPALAPVPVSFEVVTLIRRNIFADPSSIVLKTNQAGESLDADAIATESLLAGESGSPIMNEGFIAEPESLNTNLAVLVVASSVKDLSTTTLPMY